MKISSSFQNPAILIGNGLNNYSRLPISWIDLLLKLSNNAISRDVLKEKEISYPEFYDAVSFNNKKAMRGYKSLKEDICREIKKWKGTGSHEKFVQFAIDQRIPILTTNYDTTLINGEIADFHKSMKCSFVDGVPMPLKNRESFTDYYPWNSHFTNHDMADVKSEFAIWHIHGFHCYKRSLSIGAIDYANNISRLKGYLPYRKMEDLETWIGKDSWVDVFFNCDLVIVGLSLESQETSLRWLLMEREKYFRKSEDRRRRTKFIFNREYDTCGKGKEYLFRSLSIEIDGYDNSAEIYDKIELV